MTQLTVNIDMDGVIYDMVAPLVDLARTEEAQSLFEFDKASITTKVEDWDIADAWGMRSKTQFWKFFYWAIEEGLFRSGPAIDGAIESVGNIVASGHRVRIVTSKQFNGARESHIAQTDVLYWLYMHAPEWAHKVEIAFASNKQGYEADVVIDDKPSLGWVQQGKVNVLFHHDWNAKVDAPPVGMYPTSALGLYRAETWMQVEYLVGRASVR